MNTENKTVDICVEANVSYGLVLQFEDVDTLKDSQSYYPIDITGATFRASIKDSLETTGKVLESFGVNIINPKDGVVSMSLTKAQTTNLSAKASLNRDKYNPRLRFVGYYDLIMTKASSATDFRVIEGKVYISDGATA